MCESVSHYTSVHICYLFDADYCLFLLYVICGVQSNQQFMVLIELENIKKLVAVIILQNIKMQGMLTRNLC